MLIGARQLIKQCRLSAVLISDQREGKKRSFRKRISAPLRMKNSLLAEARVRHLASLAPALIRRGRRFDRCNPDLCCIRKAQRKLVAVNAQLQRIPERRKFYQRYLRTGNYAHIKKMLAERNCVNPGRLPDFQIFNCHLLISPYLRDVRTFQIAPYVLPDTIVPRTGGKCKYYYKNGKGSGTPGAYGALNATRCSRKPFCFSIFSTVSPATLQYSRTSSIVWAATSPWPIRLARGSSI